MGADRWGVCPRCQAVREQRIATAAALVKAAYGTVPPEEFVDLTQRHTELERTLRDTDSQENRTLREDWELVTQVDGAVYIRYSTGCTKCPYQFQFKHEEQTA